MLRDELAPLSTTDFATQSTPRHVAIIMDGNRRWARARGLPPASGHRAGLERLADLLPAVRATRVNTLTVFAFATANWQREPAEVQSLMRLATEAMRRFAPTCIKEGLKVEIIGRQDRLPETLRRGIDRLVRRTANGRRRLRIALDYSARESILDAARLSAGNVDVFREALCPGPDVDLLIRTGKEQRLSDFMLWECAFAELYFPDRYWPDFDNHAFAKALSWYRRRERRFGA